MAAFSHQQQSLHHAALRLDSAIVPGMSAGFDDERKPTTSISRFSGDPVKKISTTHCSPMGVQLEAQATARKRRKANFEVRLGRIQAGWIFFSFLFSSICGLVFMCVCVFLFLGRKRGMRRRRKRKLRRKRRRRRKWWKSCRVGVFMSERGGEKQQTITALPKGYCLLILQINFVKSSVNQTSSAFHLL